MRVWTPSKVAVVMVECAAVAWRLGGTLILAGGRVTCIVGKTYGTVSPILRRR